MVGRAGLELLKARVLLLQHPKAREPTPKVWNSRFKCSAALRAASSTAPFTHTFRVRAKPLDTKLSRDLYQTR